MSGPRARVLLIGNSRWHWAETSDRSLLERVFPADRSAAMDPGEPGAGAQDPCDQARSAVINPCPPDRGKAPWIHRDASPPAAATWPASEILAWAAVGPVPEAFAGHLSAERRLQTSQVPLEGAPPWLGVDRALVAWQAWRRQQALEPAPVLVADAGTALSLTLVGRQGRFLGGRLLAGAALQWRAMAAGTAQLPELAAGGMANEATGEGAGAALTDLWPQATAAAMEIGVIQGLAAAVAHAHGQLRQGAEPRAGDAAAAWQGMGDLRLWLCGGDGPRLAPLLRVAGVPVIEAPHLAMEALIRLALNQLAGIS